MLHDSTCRNLPQVMLHDSTYRNLLWTTDGSVRHSGFTLTYKPILPTLTIPWNTPAPEGFAGINIMPTFHDYADRVQNPHIIEGGDAARSNFALLDYVKPDAICTTSMLTCPVTPFWDWFNYTLPEPGIEPGFGSCLQQEEVSKSGKSRSYFMFEKMTCGALRYFDKDRQLLIDSIELIPDQNEIKQYICGASFSSTERGDHPGSSISPKPPGISEWQHDAICIVVWSCCC